jgi:hypothetical protein
MKPSLTTLLLAAAIPSLGAAPWTVRRGDILIRAKAAGTVVPEDVFRLKSTIEGRIESVTASSASWRDADHPLATLASKELAAVIDSGEQSPDLVEDRWSNEHRPTQVRCPDACYVLKVYAKARAWVKPQALLFEAASKLKLVGRVPPEDAALIREGMTLTFWPVKDPARRLTAKIERVVFDRDEKEAPGATISLNMTPGRTLAPGTQWEGEIIPLRKSAVLAVPTAALIVRDGIPYLPIRVSTGLTTAQLTQITAGVEEGREFMILDDDSLHGATRHAPAVDRAALELRRREQDAPAAPDRPAAPEHPAAPAAEAADGDDKTPAERQPSALDDKNYGGEDPYGEQ